MPLIQRKIVKRISVSLLALFLILNIIACFHAYKFTHFGSPEIVKTKDARHLSVSDKVKTLFLGINNPRPENKTLPKQKYQTIKLKSNKEIECWLINTDSAKGTVILFHGFSGEKSLMLDKAEIFLNSGYNTLLVDFMGSGGSEGNQTTLGFYEAEEVKTAFDYVFDRGEKNIILFGTSMGAAAIMKAMNDNNLPASSIILECPFGTILETVQARFKKMNVPSFPMANLLIFWGGIENNFNAFNLKPEEYAKKINCPTLLLYGEKDEKVSMNEIRTIFDNLLSATKFLETYPMAGHENYLHKYKKKWEDDITKFLEACVESKK